MTRAKYQRSPRFPFVFFVFFFFFFCFFSLSRGSSKLLSVLLLLQSVSQSVVLSARERQSYAPLQMRRRSWSAPRAALQHRIVLSTQQGVLVYGEASSTGRHECPWWRWVCFRSFLLLCLFIPIYTTAHGRSLYLYVSLCIFEFLLEGTAVRHHHHYIPIPMHAAIDWVIVKVCSGDYRGLCVAYLW